MDPYLSVIQAADRADQAASIVHRESESAVSQEPSSGQWHKSIFFAFGSVLVFCVTARLTNTDTYEWSNKLSSSAPAWKFRPPTNDEMRRARYYTLGKVLQEHLAHIKDAVEEWPQTIKAMVVWSYIQIAQPILDTTEGRRVCWAIGAVNGMLYLAWQFPRTRAIMQTSFLHSPLSGRSYTMLTSLFRSLAHVVLGSMALASFGSATSQCLFEKHSKDPENLREASPKWHFVAFFVSAGLFANLVSHVAASRITFPRLVSRLRKLPTSSITPLTSASTPPAKGFIGWMSSLRASPNTTEAAAKIPVSLGASGAVYATLTFVALAYPDTDLATKIPPTFPIPIQWGLCSLLVLDVMGIWRGWRLFNHWAHLGGAAFGAFYWEYGTIIWEVFRELTLGSLPSSLCNLNVEGEEEE
ncbi:uncharacterized protein FIBRA_00567 [Fibroporia radiculosa]|uniref:Peptidase S54 rhomboid domain-containing protein n=1 Tax=Fibroporia radiculosa TaxID=599839 RepID=J4HRT7_9APHY|nr:uncharacterized protein FIBRA_00567 [Fibroporia radiculosa]CCL98567.1 predicted protein [Fibroporia radiculosa]